jgi:DNA-binding PucR family transcriptional regulator
VRVRVGEFLGRPSGQGHAAGAAPGGVRPPGGDPPLHDVLLASAPGPVLRSLRERLLSPVLDYDAAHNAELLSTLQSFLACDGSWSACASRMYVHVNTVRYRIGRIEELTGRDLSALPDRVDFFLALRRPGHGDTGSSA